jgi:hypothetical protein
MVIVMETELNAMEKRKNVTVKLRDIVKKMIIVKDLRKICARRVYNLESVMGNAKALK